MRPSSISENGYKALFSYDTNGNRIKMNLSLNDTLKLNRYYIGGVYEIDETLENTKERLYLGGDAYTAAAVLEKEGSNWKVNYIGRDYLGSITHVIDATGVVKQELSYDPWGRLRDPKTQQVYDITEEVYPVLAYRGYTGHEHLPMFGLINMNARLYDPVLGRFLSPDPYVQAPDFSQNFNRYSYALNNPLRYTDPNGEFFWAPIIIGAVIGGAGYTASVALSDGGFSNWNWGNFGKSLGIGAISGAATAGVGQMFGAVGSMGIGGEVVKAYAHGLTNGFISLASSGDFNSGFFAGGLGSLAGSAFMMYGGSLANSPIATNAFSSLVGGVGAELSGGDFWQGAAIGLMNAGLNHLAQAVTKPSFDDLLANFPMNENGGEMSAKEVYELIGGKVLSEHLRDPKAYNNACALRVSRALNGSGVNLPNIPGKTLSGADGRNYFYRAKDLYNWMTQSYGKPNISTTDYSSLKGNKGAYFMQANYPARFGAWGHATLYNSTNTIGNPYANAHAYRFYLWNF